jgi:GTPase SAR1 family protein
VSSYFWPLTRFSSRLVLVLVVKMWCLLSGKKPKADVDDKVLLDSGQPVPCLLLGNKSDLPGRTISDDEIDAFCKQAGFIGYHAVSAKTAEKVEDAMMHLLRYLLSTSAAPEAPEADSFRLGDDDGPSEKKSSCCGD